MHSSICLDSDMNISAPPVRVKQQSLVILPALSKGVKPKRLRFAAEASKQFQDKESNGAIYEHELMLATDLQYY